MAFQISEQENENVLVLSDDVGVPQAAELHGALLPIALSSKPIVVEAQAVTSIHTSILQMLISLKQSVPRLSVRSASPAFASAVDRLGLKARLTSMPSGLNQRAPA